MFSDIFSVTVEKIKNAFEDFNNAVYNENIPKMNYKDWKSLNHFLAIYQDYDYLFVVKNKEVIIFARSCAVDLNENSICIKNDENLFDYIFPKLKRLTLNDINKEKLLKHYGYDCDETEQTIVYKKVGFSLERMSSHRVESKVLDFFNKSNNADLIWDIYSSSEGIILIAPSSDYTYTGSTYSYFKKKNVPIFMEYISDRHLISTTVTTPNIIKDIFYVNEKFDFDMHEFEGNKMKKESEENKMGINMKEIFDFDFGSCEFENLRMSPYGLAICNKAGKFVSYNPKDGTIIDVNPINFNGGKFFFKIPVGINKIEPGFVIYHNNTPVFVTDVTNGDISVIDVFTGTKSTILPTRNMFGFDFVTRIVSLIDMSNIDATKDNPFGNMLPLMMMSDGNMDAMTMVLLSGAMGGNTGFDFSNPMMLAALASSDKSSGFGDLLPLMLMTNGFGNKAGD